MKRRSVWVVVVTSMMLLTTSQADLAYAGLKSITRNVTPQGISSGTWGAVAGVDQTVTSADRAGSAYAMNLSSTCTSGSDITKTTSGSWTSGTIITLNDVIGLQVGYLVTGVGIANSYPVGTDPLSSVQRIKTLLSGNRIELTNGTSTSASGSTLTFTVAKRLNKVRDSVTGGVNDRKEIETVESVSDLVVGMVLRGANIFNSGTNTIVALTASNRFDTATGPNTDSNQIIAFTSPSGCTSSSFFTLKNTGDLAINSMSITQTGTALSAGNTLTWSTCSGTWTESTGACSTTAVTVLTTTSSSGAQQLTLALTPGQSVRIKTHLTPASGSTTLNISVSVSTSDLSPATTSNS
ncbi:MAG: hypothetical protein HW379_155 [Actinobacteria bacterium]|jgi:hypothetical protein|nr:hypothetical protein [Actinomycetota bacterium]